MYADFTAADGSVHSLELGSSVNLEEFLAALGYEGEVSSFASSNSDALDVNEEGQLVFKSAFADETITVIINGEEVIILGLIILNHDCTVIYMISFPILSILYKKVTVLGDFLTY